MEKGQGVTLTYRKQAWQVEAGQALRQAVAQVGLDPQNMLGMRGGKIISDDALLQEGDQITLVAVISGG